MTDEQLRELYARAMEAQHGCITPEQMLALVRHEGPEPRRLAWLDHVMACAACRREFDLLRAVEQAGSDIGATRGGVSLRDRWWRHPATWATAAMLLVAFGIDAGRRADISSRAPQDLTRGGTDAVVLIAPAPSASATLPLTLAWHAVAGARQYRVEVLDSAGAVAFSATTADTAVVIPRTAPMRAGAEFGWWIRAETVGGELRSPLLHVRISGVR